MTSNTVRLGTLILLSTIFFSLSSTSWAQSEQKRDCIYRGRSYEHGEIREDSRGNKYRCDNGVWRRVRSRR